MSRGDLLSECWSESETLGAITICRCRTETTGAVREGSQHDELRLSDLLVFKS